MAHEQVAGHMFVVSRLVHMLTRAIFTKPSAYDGVFHETVAFDRASYSLFITAA